MAPLVPFIIRQGSRRVEATEATTGATFPFKSVALVINYQHLNAGNPLTSNKSAVLTVETKSAKITCQGQTRRRRVLFLARLASHASVDMKLFCRWTLDHRKQPIAIEWVVQQRIKKLALEKRSNMKRPFIQEKTSANSIASTKKKRMCWIVRLTCAKELKDSSDA